MHGHEAANAVIFGIDPLWMSTAILVLAYVILLSEKVHRTVIALFGAGVAIVTGVLNQTQAIAGIDFNTIALLTGMMIIVGITKTTGVFEFVAIWSAKKVKASLIGILIALSIVTAVFSAFLDNLTTVLLVVPVALLLADKLKLSPYPFLVSQILASNVGGTATLIGDPPNILIGSATGLTFMQFLTTLGPVAAFIMVLMAISFYFIWGKSLVAAPELRERIMHFHEADSISDRPLMIRCLVVLVLVILGFVIGEHYHIRPGSTAMTGAALLLLVVTFGMKESEAGQKVHLAFVEVEWPALFFFIGLFVIVTGVEHAGLLTILGKELMILTDNDPAATTFVTLWLAAVVSAAIDNIPFVATMIPLVETMEAGLGGNGSLIGAAANVMVAGLGERAGYPISFAKYIAYGLPFMLASMVIAHGYMYLRFFL